MKIEKPESNSYPLVNQLFDHSKKYNNSIEGKSCPNCSSISRSECCKCMDREHFFSDGNNAKKVSAVYNPYQGCEHLPHQYILSFSKRYASEIAQAIGAILFDEENRLSEAHYMDFCIAHHFYCLKQAYNLRVISLGCGPCTDLLAFDFLRRAKFDENPNDYILKYINLEYCGIDYSTDFWKPVLDEIKTIIQRQKDNNRGLCRYINADFLALDLCNDSENKLQAILNKSNEPYILTLNYLLSAIDKFCTDADTTLVEKEKLTQKGLQFADNIVSYFQAAPVGSYIIINDVNSQNDNFKVYSHLLEALEGLTSDVNKYHVVTRRCFYNPNYPSAGRAGYQVERFNESIVATTSSAAPCGSLQLIIQKLA